MHQARTAFGRAAGYVSCCLLLMNAHVKIWYHSTCWKSDPFLYGGKNMGDNATNATNADYIRNLKTVLACRVSRVSPLEPTAASARLTRDFVSGAAIGNLYELRVASLALDLSSCGELKSLAQRLLTDHRQSSQRLQSTLKMAECPDTEIAVPYQMDVRHQGMVDHLMLLDDREFRPIFLRQQKVAYEEAVDLFREYDDIGENEALRGFARITLKFLERRLEQVLKLS